MTPSPLSDNPATMSPSPLPPPSWPEYLQASWLRCAHQTSATLWHPPHSAKGQTLHSLRQQADRPLGHDHLFHTVLGLLDVHTALYERAWDFSAACRAQSMAAAR